MSNGSTQTPAVKKQRLLSIDALRGFDMIWILGAEKIFAGLFILTGLSIFELFDQQMKHTAWHGITAYDIIFPLFIFLSGVSLGIAGKPLSVYPKDQQKAKLRHANKRLLILIGLGVIYNHGWGVGMPASLDDIRFASVLGRIGISWYVAAMIVWFLSVRAQWGVAVGVLVGYWLALTFVSIGQYGGGDLSSTGSLNVWFDQVFLPGATYQNNPLDPEGILSNIPSIVNALIGVFVCRQMILLQSNPSKLTAQLVGAGIVLLAVGYAWSSFFPLNKTLWTSSFVLVTCGYSSLILALFYFLIDVMKFQQWAKFFAVIGTNSIIAYLGMSIVDWKFTAKSLTGGLIQGLPEVWHDTLTVIALVLVQWFVLLWLYKRKLFIKV